jgi:heterotetrameric sarcosine oxidase gamma subunit
VMLHGGDDDFLVITGTGQRVADLAWLRRFDDGERVELSDVTDDTSVLALMGPASRDILAKVCDADLSLEAFPFSTSQELEIAGVPCRAVRITYVGELGWELHVPRVLTAALYDGLHAAGRGYGLVNGGYYAINSLRLEKGYRQWGADITFNDRWRRASASPWPGTRRSPSTVARRWRAGARKARPCAGWCRLRSMTPSPSCGAASASSATASASGTPPRAPTATRSAPRSRWAT